MAQAMMTHTVRNAKPYERQTMLTSSMVASLLNH